MITRLFAPRFLAPLGALSLTLSSTQAEMVYYQPFDYPDGESLEQQEGWSETGNEGPDDVVVGSGSLSLPGFAAPKGHKAEFSGAGSDSRTTFPALNSGTVYASFLFKVAFLDMPLAPDNMISVTGMQDADSIHDGSAMIVVRTEETDLSSYYLGLSMRNQHLIFPEMPNPLTVGETYLIVLAYEFKPGATNNDVTRLWINPGPGSFGGESPPEPDLQLASKGNDAKQMSGWLLNQQASNATPGVELDEIRVGSTWASVTPAE